MSNSYFRFRQFTIHQSHTAMKVSTDACLFGAFIAHELHSLIPAVDQDSHVLDIGSGTGLLTLMLAQQHVCRFDMVEIEQAAFEEGRTNVDGSPWSTQITCHHANLLDFVPKHSYRIIVCNPPFHAGQLQAPQAQRNLARHETALTLAQILDFAVCNLDADGHLFLLLPAGREDDVQDESSKRNLFLNKKVMVRHSPAHPVSRIIWLWSRQHPEAILEQISIREPDGAYSAAFSYLLGEYYL